MFHMILLSIIESILHYRGDYMLNIGEQYGNIKILELHSINAHYDKIYLCECICGKRFIRKGSSIQKAIERNNIPSCGCTRKKSKKPLTFPTYNIL